MNSSLHDRTLALAGLFQAARLTQQLAREGRAEPQALGASIESLFMINAATTEEVFGGAGGVAMGLKFLRDKLSGATEPGDMEVARYVISLLHLERQFEKRPEVQDAVQRGLAAAESQARSPMQVEANEPISSGAIEKNRRALYPDRQHPRAAHSREWRTGLPRQYAHRRQGALRAVRRHPRGFLWRQLGGRRWQLLFQRRAIANAAGEILRGKSE